MNNNINTQVYAQKVELLLRLMPIVMEEGVFAVHGGTAINLVKWKLINLAKLAKQNPQKLVEEACKLELLFGI